MLELPLSALVRLGERLAIGLHFFIPRSSASSPNPEMESPSGHCTVSALTRDLGLHDQPSLQHSNGTWVND